MKVNIGPPKNYFGPYQLAEKIIFWADSDSDLVYRFGGRLSEIGWLTNLCEWVDEKRKRTVKVRIDNYDTWNMDDTLSHIIVPMLRQLKTTQHGAPYVADRDVPKELRSTNAPPKENDYDIDDNHFKRWEWVLGEMIFAFESYLRDDDLILIDNGKVNKKNIKLMKDREKRVANGLRLFGVYYRGLWD